MRIIGVSVTDKQISVLPPHQWRLVIASGSKAGPIVNTTKSIIKILNPLTWASRYGYLLGFNGEPKPEVEVKDALKSGISRVEYFSKKYGPYEGKRLLPMGDLVFDHPYWIGE